MASGVLYKVVIQGTQEWPRPLLVGMLLIVGRRALWGLSWAW